LAPSKNKPGIEGPKPAPVVPEEKSAIPEPAKGTTGARSDRGLLTIQVPAGARVFINDYETRSQGTRRQYVSTGLLAGNLYPYTIRVTAPRLSPTSAQAGTGPQWQTRVETVYLKAGDHLSLDFQRGAERVLVARAE
jgi:uncharacterized protein (TIGR03000 family)